MPTTTPNLTDAWTTLTDYIDGQDDFTDRECEAIDAIHAAIKTPAIPVAELAAAIGLPDADENGILPGSAADQCAAIYELLQRYGVTVG